MYGRATGRFDVTLEPQSTDAATGVTLTRLSIVKRFHGDLEASSRGEMLAARTTVPDSAGYVAVEHVSGTLAGRAGAFCLQHSGTMTKGQQRLSIQVVPDSGTDGLAGLEGEMDIRLEDGVHFYDFAYRLPAEA